MFPDEGKPNEKLISSDLMDKFFIYSTDVNILIKIISEIYLFRNAEFITFLWLIGLTRVIINTTII